jgi:signal transduction histidine kinase
VSALALTGWLLAACAAGGFSAARLRLVRHAELVADAGHELRGPLCAARLGLHGLDDAERAAAVDLELRRAVLALEDLVAASHGGRARLRSELVDVGALLDDGAEAWAPLAAAFGSSLSVEPLRGRALVRADALRLAQACGNLVANALEHGGSPVRVRGRVVAGRVRIEVADAGPGLPEPVSRLIARRRRGAPRGRGLTIAARIARDHGGRLSSAPSAGGACLVIELPSADAAIEPLPPSRFDPTWRPDTRPIPLDPSWRPAPRSAGSLRRRPADPDPDPPPSRPLLRSAGSPGRRPPDPDPEPPPPRSARRPPDPPPPGSSAR